jgi:hypothetical protein
LVVFIFLLISVVDADDSDEGVDGGADPYDEAEDLEDESRAVALPRPGRDDEAEPKVRGELEPEGERPSGRQPNLLLFAINGVLPLSRQARLIKGGPLGARVLELRQHLPRGRHEGLHVL